MKMFKTGLITALLAISLSHVVLAKDDMSATEKLLRDLERQLLLNKEQFEKLAPELKRALESSAQQLAEELSEYLLLTQRQAEKIRPIIQDTLDKQAQLLHEFTLNGGKQPEVFAREYERLIEESRRRVKEALEQDRLERRRDEYRERLKEQGLREA